MRNSLINFCLVLIAVFAVSCKVDDATDTIYDVSGEIPLSLTVPDQSGQTAINELVGTSGALFKTVNFQRCKEDAEEYSFYAATDGKTKDMFVNLSFTIVGLQYLKIGREINLSNWSYGYGLSSNSEDCVNSYKGNKYKGQVILKDYADGYIVLRFNGMSFSLSNGDHILNGDVKCKITL